MTVPIGTIMAYAGDNSGESIGYLQEQGWLFCNGKPYSSTEYEHLFHIIGTYYGTAETPGNFLVPDLRGRFVRGVDHGAERDPDASKRTPSGPGGHVGDHVGSLQESKPGVVWNKGHIHSGGDYGAVFPELPNDKFGESRPVNIYVNWIIKARDVG
ncbi:MAG: phage tail protein [Xenococcaceae cyanobacterium MO_207.B15]|nr:phage tail protein [Xenococcaceae cyanobacterium MO_207.B15]